MVKIEKVFTVKAPWLNKNINLKEGWVVLPAVEFQTKEMRKARGTWVQISSKKGTIYRLASFSRGIPGDRPLAELPTVDELCMDLPSGMIVPDGTGGD